MRLANRIRLPLDTFAEDSSTVSNGVRSRSVRSNRVSLPAYQAGPERVTGSTRGIEESASLATGRPDIHVRKRRVAKKEDRYAGHAVKLDARVCDRARLARCHRARHRVVRSEDWVVRDALRLGLCAAPTGSGGRDRSRVCGGEEVGSRRWKWWRRRESNPRPEASRGRPLHAQPLLNSRPAA